jgi:hypothetical protein
LLQARRGRDLRSLPQGPEGSLSLKGTGSLILDGQRISIPEGICIRVAPKVYRALVNDSKKGVDYMILGAVPPKKLSARRQDFVGRQYSEPEKSAALEEGVGTCLRSRPTAFRWRVGLEDFTDGNNFDSIHIIGGRALDCKRRGARYSR